MVSSQLLALGTAPGLSGSPEPHGLQVEAGGGLGPENRQNVSQKTRSRNSILGLVLGTCHSGRPRGPEAAGNGLGEVEGGAGCPGHVLAPSLQEASGLSRAPGLRSHRHLNALTLTLTLTLTLSGVVWILVAGTCSSRGPCEGASEGNRGSGFSAAPFHAKRDFSLCRCYG